MSDGNRSDTPLYTTSDAWDDAARWMERYRAACPDDEREDIDIYLDEDVYAPESPYWEDTNE